MHVIAPLQRANHGSHFRAYGLRGVATLINPFIGIDHAWMSAPTFPPHPHSRFSAVSYLFLDSETAIANRDSIGTRNLIQPGGLHWITAGSGVVHDEVPAETGKTVHSLQIFVALPLEQQDVTPFALTLEPQDVPVVQLVGAKVRVPLGSYGGVRSPLRPPTDVDMYDISLDDGAELVLPIAPGQVAFVMPIFGAIDVDGQAYAPDDLKAPVFQPEDMERTLTLKALRGAAKVMFFGGVPLTSTAN